MIETGLEDGIGVGEGEGEHRDIFRDKKSTKK